MQYHINWFKAFLCNSLKVCRMNNVNTHFTGNKKINEKFKVGTKYEIGTEDWNLKKIVIGTMEIKN